jgi:hypothetical protein
MFLFSAGRWSFRLCPFAQTPAKRRRALDGIGSFLLLKTKRSTELSMRIARFVIPVTAPSYASRNYRYAG